MKRIVPCAVLLALTAGCALFDPGEDESVGPRQATAADGTVIDYEVAGSGRPALVFIHGWGCDRLVWKRQFERFARSNRVVAIDLARGDGSGRLDWSIDALASDVAAVVENEKLVPAILIGHSLGALVAVEAAGRLTENVAAVVGIEALHDVERSQAAEVQRFVQQLEKDYPGTIRSAVPKSFGPKATPEDVAQVVKTMAATDPHVAIALENSYAAFDFPGALERATVPIRLINARPTNVAGNRRHAKDFSVVQMAGVGFFPMLEDPDTFASVLVTVLEELRVAEWLGPSGAVPSRTAPSLPPRRE